MSKKKSTSRLRIALAVIARNEEQFIGGCLDSARPYVDEMVVLDTGSTDRTEDVAREHGARVAHFTWINDFGAARNAAIDAVNADWVLMLDADERLVPEAGPLLRQLTKVLPANCHGYTMRIDSVHVVDSGEMVVADRIPRFFPRRDDVRWIGAIHEDLRYLPDPSKTLLVGDSGLHAIHYGYDPQVYAERGKDQRNLDILEQARTSNPDDARLVYFTGQQHFALKRWSEAAGYFKTFLGAPRDLPFVYEVEAVANLLSAQFELGDSAALRETAAQAEKAGALSIVAYMVLGQEAERNGDLKQALEYYERTLDTSLPQGFTLDPSIGSWRSRVRIALTEAQSGNFARGYDVLEQALAEAPSQQVANIASDAARLTLVSGELQRGESWLRRAAVAAADDFDTQLNVLQLGIELAKADATAPLAPLGSPRLVEQALAREDWQQVYDAVMNLDHTSAGAVARVMFAAANLREQGAPEAALDLLSRAMDRAPTEERFYVLLVQTLRDLERYDEAVEVLELLQAA